MILRCPSCSAPVLEAITPEAVVTVDGLSVLFRRHTDYVLCPSCAEPYNVLDLRLGRTRLVAEPAGR